MKRPAALRQSPGTWAESERSSEAVLCGKAHKGLPGGKAAPMAMGTRVLVAAAWYLGRFKIGTAGDGAQNLERSLNCLASSWFHELLA